MKNSKIGILCTYKFPEGMAPTIRILSYGQGLVLNGYEVEVVIFQPKVGDDGYPLGGAVNGVKYAYSYRRDPNKSKYHKVLVDRPRALINAIKLIRKSHKVKKFDCVLLSFDDPKTMLFFAPILRFMGIPVGFIGDEFPEPIRKLKNRIPLSYKLGYKLVYHFISFRILMTNALKEFYNITVCIKPTYILCSVLDTNRFVNIKRQEPPRKYLCYMGNMMLAKDNVDNIIRAFARISTDVSDIDLYLYGTPNDDDRMVVEGEIDKLNLGNRVFLKGRVDYSLVPQILANAEVLVTSQPITKRAAGGFPTKLAEYMMSHTPAIVTDVGEISCYVQDSDTVYMVRPCDDFEYANKLRYILAHPDEARMVAGRAYEYASQNFGVEQVTKGLCTFFDSVLR